MRLAALSLALVATVASSGCADWYYQTIGRGDWPHQDRSLYTRMGAKPGVTAVVDQLTANVMLDPRVSGYFAHADLPRMKALMVEQLCMLGNGPCIYTGRGMADAHAELRITDAAFDAFVEDLRQSLEQTAVPEDARQELLHRLAPLRAQIVAMPG